MKPERRPLHKLRTAASTAGKSPCGTLSYLAECRGAMLKSVTVRRPAPAGMAHRFERRFPAD